MAALFLVGALLLAVSRMHWLRLHETASPLSSSAIGFRVTAIGLLTGAAVIILVGALSLAPIELVLAAVSARWDPPLPQSSDRFGTGIPAV